MLMVVPCTSGQTVHVVSVRFFYLIFVMLNYFLMLSYIDKGMVCDLCKGSFVSYVKYDLIIHPNQ